MNIKHIISILMCGAAPLLLTNCAAHTDEHKHEEKENAHEHGDEIHFSEQQYISKKMVSYSSSLLWLHKDKSFILYLYYKHLQQKQICIYNMPLILKIAYHFERF